MKFRWFVFFIVICSTAPAEELAPVAFHLSFETFDFMADDYVGQLSPDRTPEDRMLKLVGVGWIEGGGPDLGRLVEYSGYDRLRVEMYSFDSFDREVVMRLFRLDNGEYSVTLSADNDGDRMYEKVLLQEKKHIKRFNRLAITVPPNVPVMLEVSQIKADPDPGPLPDLAVNDYYVTFDRGSIKATIHNIGCAPSGSFTVSVLDPQGNEIAKKSMDSLPGAEDFVPKQAKVVFRDLPVHPHYMLAIDREDVVEEIFEENNAAAIFIR